MNEFATPSCVVAHADSQGASGFWLFRGQGVSGVDPIVGLPSIHAFELLWAASPTTATGALNFNTYPFSGVGMNSKFVTQAAYADAYPYACMLDEESTLFVYAGYEPGTITGSANGIYAHVFQGDERIIQAQSLVGSDLIDPIANRKTYPSAAHIGVCSIPGESGVLLAYCNTKGELSVQYCQWQADANPPALVVTSPTIGTWEVDGPTDWTGEVGLCVAANPYADATPETPFVALITLSGKSGVSVTRVLVGLDDNRVPILNTANGSWNPGVEFNFLSLYRGADGVAYYQGYRDCFETGVAPQPGTTGPQIFSSSIDSKTHGVSQAAPVIYAFSNSFDNANPVDVYRIFIFSDSKSYRADTVGQARRDPIDEINTAATAGSANPLQGILVGIIEGGPPVPNENVQDRDLSAPDSEFATLVFGQTTTNSTDWKVSGSVGAFVKIKGEAGVPGLGTVSGSVEVGAGVTGAFSRTTEEVAVTTTVATTSAIVNSNGQKVVNPIGGVVLLQPAYYGYTYTFLDSKGNPLSDACPMIQIYLDSSLTVTSTLSYDIDPTATSGIIPGELHTYPSAPSTDPQLPSVKGSVQGAYSGGVSLNASSSSLEGGSKSVGAYFDMQRSVGVSVGGEEIGAKASVTVGMKMRADFDYTWLESTNDELSCESKMDTVSSEDEQVNHAYSSYTFEAVMYSHNQAFTTDLLTQLQGYPTKDNQYLASLISPNSAPWKITYIVPTAYQPYPEVSSPAPSADLVAAGIPNASVACKVAQGIGADRLTPKLRGALEEYMATLRDSSREAFRKRHPQWRGYRTGKAIAAGSGQGVASKG